MRKGNPEYIAYIIGKLTHASGDYERDHAYDAGRGNEHLRFSTEKANSLG